jgi:hypothetical protein
MDTAPIVDRALDRLLQSVLESERLFRSERSLRTAWIMVPRSGLMVAAYMFPFVAEYANLREHFVVAQWHEAEVERLFRDHKTAMGKGLGLKESELRIRKELQKHASVTGYAYANGGLHLFPDLNDCLYRCDHSKHLPLERRDDLMFRSKAAIRLEYGDRRLGVLLLCDTAIGGFMNPDKSRIETVASLTSPFVARGLDENHFSLAA